MTSCLGSRLALLHTRFENARCGRRFFLNTKKKNRFREYPATCGRSNTIQKRYVWTQIFLKTEEKVSVFENTRLTCGQGLRGRQVNCKECRKMLLVILFEPFISLARTWKTTITSSAGTFTSLLFSKKPFWVLCNKKIHVGNIEIRVFSWLMFWSLRIGWYVALKIVS